MLKRTHFSRRTNANAMVSQRRGDNMSLIFGGKFIELVGDMWMSISGVEIMGSPCQFPIWRTIICNLDKYIWKFEEIHFVNRGDMRMSKWGIEIDGQPLPSQIHSITEQWPPVDKKDDNVYPYPKIERDKDLFVDFCCWFFWTWSGHLHPEIQLSVFLNLFKFRNTANCISQF